MRFYFKTVIYLFSLIIFGNSICFAENKNSVDIKSTILSYEYPFPFRVYLPENYNTLSSLPVLYLLHGQGQSEFLWENIGIVKILDELILEKVIGPMIVVMPRESYYYQNMDESDFPDSVIYTLIPLIDNTFKTNNSRNYRAIGGISRGALWAQKIAFEHMDKFTAVGAHSLPNPFFSNYMLNKYLKTFEDYSCPDLYIDTGDMDPYALGSSDFSMQLFSFKIPHTLIVSPGNHDEDYWEDHIKDYLVWYDSCFKKCF